MRELTRTEAIDLVGRYEAEQEIPEAMRADVRMLGSMLGRVLRESGSPGLFDDVERLRGATIQAYTDDSPRHSSARQPSPSRSASRVRTRWHAPSPSTSTS